MKWVSYPVFLLSMVWEPATLYCTSIFLSIYSYHNSISADQYRLIVSRAQVSTHRVKLFFWSYPVTSCYFSNDCRLKLIFLKCIWNSCLREWKLLSLYVFCRVIFISLIVSSPSRNFYSCAAYFQSYINIACTSVAKNAVRKYHSF